MKPRFVRRREHFFTFVKKTNSCWLWIGGLAGGRKPGGEYGQFRVGGLRQYVYAHRYSYEIHKGRIPGGFTVDHSCGNKLCVNPAHLEAVTLSENCLRRKRRRLEKTRVGNGHEQKAEPIKNVRC